MNTKVKLRDDPFFDLQEAIKKMLQGVDGKSMCQTCLNCKYFTEATEICGKYRQRPPARVIANSCESYEDVNSIPF